MLQIYCTNSNWFKLNKNRAETTIWRRNLDRKIWSTGKNKQNWSAVVRTMQMFLPTNAKLIYLHNTSNYLRVEDQVNRARKTINNVLNQLYDILAELNILLALCRRKIQCIPKPCWTNYSNSFAVYNPEIRFNSIRVSFRPISFFNVSLIEQCSGCFRHAAAAKLDTRTNTRTQEKIVSTSFSTNGFALVDRHLHSFFTTISRSRKIVRRRLRRRWRRRQYPALKAHSALWILDP